jgi:hypothetical protein
MDLPTVIDRLAEIDYGTEDCGDERVQLLRRRKELVGGGPLVLPSADTFVLVRSVDGGFLDGDEDDYDQVTVTERKENGWVVGKTDRPTKFEYNSIPTSANQPQGPCGKIELPGNDDIMFTQKNGHVECIKLGTKFDTYHWIENEWAYMSGHPDVRERFMFHTKSWTPSTLACTETTASVLQPTKSTSSKSSVKTAEH